LSTPDWAKRLHAEVTAIGEDMLSRILITTLLISAAASSPLDAQHQLPGLEDVIRVPEPKMTVPEAVYLRVPGSLAFTPGSGVPTRALLAALSFWISDNFDLPGSDVLPAIELVRPARITALRHGGLVRWQMEGAAPGQAGQREVVAVYGHAMLLSLFCSNASASCGSSRSARTVIAAAQRLGSRR
jgi:hypothetical protein